MESREESAIVSLLDKDPELKKYYDEHQALEKQLAALHHKGHLSTDEEVEIKRIQKLKLAGKDKMMEILGKHRQMGNRG
ncbi:MAG TPA: DUF465 domain-containing protein [Candidatus Binatia bacterium]|jgi:uncharacterized protein|nr:DUF465 domain-containing protein [Candidatus Binatia bacterium]